MKRKKTMLMILCGAFFVVCVLFLFLHFLMPNIKKEENQMKPEAEKVLKTEDIEKN